MPPIALAPSCRLVGSPRVGLCRQGLGPVRMVARKESILANLADFAALVSGRFVPMNEPALRERAARGAEPVAPME